ncbi:MAG: aldehyde dehydrogenase family protein, partial [Bacteroidetes bacterium]
MLSLRNYIGGQLCVPQTGRYIDVWEPARGEVWAEAPDSGPEDVAAAVAAAKEAFPAWSRTSAHERAELLLAIAAGIRQRFEALATAESRDSGKPLALARRMDIPRAEENFRFFAHACTQFHSETFDMGSGFNYVLRRPAGVAALISPWNLPLYLFSWKIAP